ncbi:Nucleotide-binding universal stress protein, UspA family [Dehalogenimonas formicexedens]|uniref:Nucleotide-binding universal stress protein, UspA family n=1 Tax=Dehalogenimonas formicexedens TaxID=1839801 RepID=A0A1P8FAA5_9CHLR|nr:universal stress protein [Dehalogenimonas formicexedens]APV45380.1 Nucleotide-binding universal stress protein, UspA family [Dehalogenimonas formicexedens]
MIKEVVIPLDGSAEAEITVPYGMALAQKLGAQLDFVSVDETGAADTGNLYRNYLRHLDERLKAKYPGQRAWQTRLQNGKAAEEILRFIEEHVADLVILSAHGASGRGSALVGKVANKIMTGTNKPALLIKSPPPENRPLISKILVPLDGSGIGQAALDIVSQLAPAFNAEVVLTQVVEPVRYLPSVDGMGAYTLPIDDAEIEADATTFLNRRAEALRQKGITVSTVVKTGSAAELIMNYARDNQVDLIAMSTHGLSGLTRWVFGSVTEKIVVYGTTPVLVVHPPGG